MKNTQETIQRSLNKESVPKQGEEALVVLLKLRYKGVKKNVKEVQQS